ncbi:MAG: 30S ribosomal protein S8 [Planctomycetes bacterium]|nr:30S ribosomal protein S8 [Planctomycetota bacterium]
MSMSDPVADMLTRIRNANSIRRDSVSMPSSKLKLSVAEVLKREGFIKGFDIVERPVQNELVVYLKYGPEGEKIIQRVVRLSTPGRRYYRSAGDLPNVLDGLGIAVVSTSKGVLSDRECRAQNVGGEVLCTVW